MQDKQTIFADGFIAKRRDDAKDFLITKLSLKVDEATAFIKKHEKNGWLNLEVKRGRSGGLYVSLDSFEPKKLDSAEVTPNQEEKWEPTDEVPF